MMPNHSAGFGGGGGGLTLANAILLYRDERQSRGHAREDAAAFASFHAVERDPAGSPTIAAGTPLTRAHLGGWAEALGRVVRPEFLPEHVLVSHPDLLIWWTPARVRTAYFALTSPPAGLKALSARTTVSVPYPAHLFVATRSGLGVFALPDDRRPTEGTTLLHSPILNVYANGQLCWGNIARPNSLTISAIPEFERAVFESWSTHPNPGQELTVTGKGGLVRLWDNLAARGATRFPVKRLMPFGTVRRRGAAKASDSPLTLALLIACGGRP